MARFLERLVSGPPLLLDSAMGTEIERRGADVLLPLWSARALDEAPEIVLAIHRENVAAGADVLTANTFRTNRRTVGERARELTRRAVRIAREAAAGAERGIFVAGSTAPVEDCYRPDLVPGEAELESEHGEHAANLASAGVDVIFLETMNTIREARIAAAAAARTGTPFVAAFVTDGRGALLSGESLREGAREVLPFEPAAVGVNCVPPGALAGELARLADAIPGVPLAAYGNVLSTGEAPAVYAALADRWIALGARLVGGCCGTTPAIVAALRSELDAVKSGR